MRFKLGKIALFIAGLVILGIVFFKWLPVAKVFINAPLLVGYDTIHFFYYTYYYNQHLALPTVGWRPFQFEGMPQIFDYAWFHFYLIQPFVWKFGIFQAVKIYPIIYLGLFLVASFLLFWEVSKRLLLAGLLTLAVSQSAALYIPLYSSGVVLSSISQTFLPFSLYFMVRFVQRGERKSFILTALMAALGLFTHVGGLLFVFIPVVLFLILWLLPQPINFWSKIKTVAVFTLIVFTVASVAFFPQVIDRLLHGGYAAIQSQFVREEGTFQNLFKATNIFLWIAFGVVALFYLPLTIKRLHPLFFPFLGAFVYLFLFMVTVAFGLNPLGGFIFPHRIFWVFPLFLAVLVAVMVTPTQKSQQFLGTRSFLGVAGILIGAILLGSLTISLPKLLYFIPDGDLDPAFHPEKYAPMTKVEEFSRYIAAEMIPNFKKEDKNRYRFYALDAGINTVIGLISPIPQVRGSFHYLNKDNADWFAWVDAVLSEESFIKKRLQPDIAKQQARFIIDWYGIRYLFSPKAEVGQMPQYLFENDDCIVWKSSPKPPATMEIAEKCTSPIIKPVRVPVIGFIGSKQGYDIFMRNLGIINFNSQYLIPIKAGEFIEDLKEEDLEVFDGLILYDYRKKGGVKEYESSWEKLGRYITDGGVVLVETGSTSPEKYTSELPNTFPVSKLVSGSVGTSWQVRTPTEIFKGIDFSKFSPLNYEGGDWTVAYSLPETVKLGGKSLLEISDKPVIVERQVGQGKIIWSGLNLPYRTMYWQDTAVIEGQVLAELLSREFNVKKEEPFDFSLNRSSSREAIVSGTGARGVLLKENNYGGWVAQSDGKNLKIYSAGPYFMFAKLPKDYAGKPFTVKFFYRGTLTGWIFFIISIIAFILTLEGLLVNNRLTKFLLNPLKRPVDKIKEKFRGFKFWWDRDEENE